jgi:O-antigen/teichoic acid export membrane protein
MLQYRGNVRRAIVMQQITSTGLALVTVVVVLAGGGLVGAFACWVAALTISAVIGRGGLHATSSTPAQSAGAAFGRVGAATTALAVVGYLNLTVDVYVVAALRTTAELGIYALAIAAAETLWHASRALLWPALGPIAGLDRAEAMALAARVCRHAMALVGAIALVAWFAAPVAIRLVYGEAFAPAGDLVRLVLPGVVAMAGEAALGSYILLALGRPRPLLVVHLVSTLACAAICVAGLPRFGLAAAAFGTSLTYCAAFVAVAVLAVRSGLPVRMLVLRG